MGGDEYRVIIDNINFLRYKKEQALRDDNLSLFDYYSREIYNKNDELEKIMLDKERK